MTPPSKSRRHKGGKAKPASSPDAPSSTERDPADVPIDEPSDVPVDAQRADIERAIERRTDSVEAVPSRGAGEPSLVEAVADQDSDSHLPSCLEEP